MRIKLSRHAQKSASKIEKSDLRIAAALRRQIEGLRKNPIPPAAKPMRGTPEGTYIIPFGGDYGRIVYFHAGDHLQIIAIGPRENIYRDWRHIVHGHLQGR